MGGLSATCSRHTLRQAVGVCVRCSTALCSDCITKIDGINHCQSCLEQLAQRPALPRPRLRVPLSDTAALGLGLGLLSLLTWLMIEVLMPGAGTL
jgi:hypothetical protein